MVTKLSKFFGNRKKQIRTLKTYTIIVSFVFFSIQILQVVSAQDLGTGLLGWWNFNETTGDTAYDASGNGNHGVIFAYGHAKSWVTGTHGGALDMDSGDVSIAGITGSIQSFSVAFFIYPRTFWEWNQSVGSKWETFTIHSGPNGACWAGIDYGYTWKDRFDSLPNIYVANTWQNFTFTYNYLIIDTVATTIDFFGEILYDTQYVVDTVTHNAKLYKDGIEIASKNMLPGPLPWESFGVGQLDGKIDDLRFYNRALTASEVTALQADVNTVSHTLQGPKQLKQNFAVRRAINGKLLISSVKKSSGIKVMLTVCNTNGKIVSSQSSIIDKNGSVTFNDPGKMLSNGMYVYRFSIGNVQIDNWKATILR